MNRLRPAFVIILVLMVIGIVDLFRSNPGFFLIPVVVLGAIFLLYKYPPGRGRNADAGSNTRKSTVKPVRNAQNKPKTPRKNIPFRVIEGGKDDENLPKYH
ncbi:hypothetical protein EBB07_29980 [Paenibacillaceae bacterium]|nr:hypothetical protein EBB07_29980 [Paenibacillaceae bacterium]